MGPKESFQQRLGELRQEIELGLHAQPARLLV